MAQKRKLQVFVSSTFEDLKDARQAAVEAILTAKHIPAGMELFASGDKSQMNVIKRWIDQSDVYLLILGGRYGSIEPKSGKSYTHLEFEYAVQQGKALFSVVITEESLELRVKENGSRVIEQENKQQFDEFRQTVESNVVRFWSDVKDIKIAILETLSEYSERGDLVGWIPGNEAVDAGVFAEEIARLNKENADLRTQIAKLSNKVSSVNDTLQPIKDSDAVILLRGYINNVRSKYDHLYSKIINFIQADKALGFPEGTSKRCFEKALSGTVYVIRERGDNSVEIKIRGK